MAADFKYGENLDITDTYVAISGFTESGDKRVHYIKKKVVFPSSILKKIQHFSIRPFWYHENGPHRSYEIYPTTLNSYSIPKHWLVYHYNSKGHGKTYVTRNYKSGFFVPYCETIRYFYDKTWLIELQDRCHG